MFRLLQQDGWRKFHSALCQQSSFVLMKPHEGNLMSCQMKGHCKLASHSEFKKSVCSALALLVGSMSSIGIRHLVPSASSGDSPRLPAGYGMAQTPASLKVLAALTKALKGLFRLSHSLLVSEWWLNPAKNEPTTRQCERNCSLFSGFFLLKFIPVVTVLEDAWIVTA